MAEHRCPFACARSQGVLRNKNYHCAWSMAVRHFAFCFVAFFTDYPCAADTFVKRIQIGSCDTEWAHITNVLYLHQTSGYWFLSHSAPQHKRAHVPCKLCLCPITVLYVGQMNSRDIHACKLTSLKQNEFQELLHQAHKAIATRYKLCIAAAIKFYINKVLAKFET